MLSKWGIPNLLRFAEQTAIRNISKNSLPARISRLFAFVQNHDRESGQGAVAKMAHYIFFE